MAGNLIFHDGRRGVPNVHSNPCTVRQDHARRAQAVTFHARIIPAETRPRRGGCTRSHPRSVQVRSFQSTIRVSSVVFRHLLDVVLALEVLALDELGDLVVVVTTLLALTALLEALVALGELAEGSKGVGAELVEDAGDELGELLVLTVAVDGEGVGGNSGVDCAVLVWLSESAVRGIVFRHTLGGGEVDDVAVRLEHVDLLDLGDGLDVHLLEGSLELLVVGARRPVDLLLHTSGGTLAAVSHALASVHLVAASFSSFNPAPDIPRFQCVELRTPRAIACACVTRPDQTRPVSLISMHSQFQLPSSPSIPSGCHGVGEDLTYPATRSVRQFS